jgi:deoxycytidylate deaminase
MSLKRSHKKYEIKATCYDKRGMVVSVGYNNYLKTHPKMAELAERVDLIDKRFLHAEVAAIIRAKGKPIHKISVERYDKNGNPKLAKPCPVCELAIKLAGISVVEYTIG